MTGARFPTHEAEERLHATAARGVPIVPLHGTPAPPLPAHVVSAVAEALGRMEAPPPRGLARLRELLGEVVGHTGRPVDPERGLVVTNGAMHALGLVFRSVLDPGDEVVVPAPCFFFEGPIRGAGGVPVYAASRPEDGWRWDVDAIERAVGEKTRAILVCMPGNPTGHVPEPAEVEAVVALAERHGLVLVADEAYEASLWDASLTSAFPLAERGLLVRSLGKSLSLPHLRLGLVAGPPGLVDGVAAALEWDVLRVGLAPQAAAIAVLEGPQGWLGDVHAELERDREAALEAAEGRFDVVPPRGGPFLFLRASADALVDAGVPAVDGRHFQAAGWARMPFGGADRSRALLETALARFPRA